mmetsp:Transcript_10875/g.13610  ORF Transcript_10875/g.13610 Transcript_10875/m.13610 type:complete len:194 (+) Transcript_10875:191-772(+)|eukprot:CAMPEP_0204859692 /NCGR_PEP_ID=MMETSP1347-20130617/23851_1 /ASSEMBLY_ACC=CAM_ASM_000690 /TAXON_ID=215587 /ORGANISM="Aplanochytrium stocchinoi, Strain GSBS06" /LENGTH=193 /DNA_ID=CAMNT_0052008229 /DNA_START=111 /DNA_END=692 /DNA_ORIENTATION=-
MPLEMTLSPFLKSNADSVSLKVGQTNFQLQRTNLHLFGGFHLRYLGFKICDCALYMKKVPSESSSGTISSNTVMDPEVSKELVIRYLQYIPRTAFQYQTRDSITRNGFLQENVEGHLNTFSQYYADVNHNDEFSLSYDAEEATSSLRLNGKLLGSIRSKPFSRAIFSVWFGEFPFMDTMKNALLSPIRSTHSK